MSLYYPAIILSQNEAIRLFKQPVRFDSNGYMQDTNMTLQKKIEDVYGQVVMFVSETTQKDVIIFFNEDSTVRTNPLNKKRLAVIHGDTDYIISTLKTMISHHPSEKPETIINSYAFQCDMTDKLAIREWTKKTYNCV